MSELEKLREAVEVASRRQDEATEVLRICRQKLRDAEAEWHKRFEESNEARTRLYFARTAQSATNPNES